MIVQDIYGTNIGSGTAFENAVRQDSRNFDAKLRIDGSDVTANIKRIEIGKGSCGGAEFTLGNIYTSTMTATLYKQDLTQDFKDKEVELLIRLKVNGYAYPVRMGYFTITDITETHYTITIKGYGRTASKTKAQFTPIANPTIASVAARIGNQMGCTVTFKNVPATNYAIDAPLYGLTVYQALQVLAGLCGGYAYDTADGNVCIAMYDDTVTTELNAGMMKTLPVTNPAYELTGVEVTVSEAVEEEGTIIPAVIYAAGNPIVLKATNRYMTYNIFVSLFAGVVGYEYNPADINLSLGDPRLEGCDVVSVEDIDGTVYTVPCHQITHIYDGGFFSRIKAVTAPAEARDIGSIGPISAILKEQRKDSSKAYGLAVQAIRIAGTTAQYFWVTETGTDTGAHITEIPKDDFLSDPEHGGGNLLARSNGIAVRDGLTELAQFSSSGVTIGLASQSHIEMLTQKIAAYAGDNSQYFAVGDLAGTAAQVSYTGDGMTYRFSVLGISEGDPATVTINGVQTNDFTVYDELIQFGTSIASGAEIIIKYEYSKCVPYMTVGSRKSGSKIGAYSLAEGRQCEASGVESHAEGFATKASGDRAHAEGYGTTASDDNAHAEGAYTTASGRISHAEGNSSTAGGMASHAEGQGTTASGYASHAEGVRTTASGSCSHAEGYACEASGDHSHAGGSGSEASYPNGFAHGIGVTAESTMIAMGRYNTDSGNLFELGNGASNRHSNAMEVDGSGNVAIAGQLSQGSDRRFKDHIDYLGDDAVEFIRDLKPAHYRKDEESHVGFYAQDVEESDKWHCMTGEMNGFKTLSYTEIIAPLVAYCQHLEKRIEELERRA